MWWYWYSFRPEPMLGFVQKMILTYQCSAMFVKPKLMHNREQNGHCYFLPPPYRQTPCCKNTQSSRSSSFRSMSNLKERCPCVGQMKLLGRLALCGWFVRLPKCFICSIAFIMQCQGLCRVY